MFLFLFNIKLFSQISFFSFFLLLFKYSYLHFHPNMSPLLYPSLPPTLKLTPFGFVHVSIIHVPWWPFPYYPLLSLSPLLSGYWQFVLYFNVSGCILIAFLFHWLGSTYRWGHMVIHSPPGLFNLEKCFPVPSIQSQMKGAPSFFLLQSIPLCKCTTGFWSTHFN